MRPLCFTMNINLQTVFLKNQYLDINCFNKGDICLCLLCNFSLNVGQNSLKVRFIKSKNMLESQSRSNINTLTLAS